MDISNIDDDDDTSLIIGPGDYIDDPPVQVISPSAAVIEELRKSTNLDETFAGPYATFLNVTPHTAAFNFSSIACSNVTVTVLYNDTAMHSLPVALNILSNAIYRALAPSDADLRPIQVQSHPLMVTAQSQEFNIGTFSSALFIGMIFVLVPVSLAIDMVYDREMKAKNQLRVNGLALSLYFTAFFVVIFGLMVLICLLLLVMVFAMSIPSFQQPSALATIGIFVVIYSPSAILCSTCSSYFFDKTDSALTFLPNILTFAGFVPFILVAFLDMMAIDAKATIALHYVLSIFNPMYIPYALIYFVDRIYIACSISNACSNLTIANYMTEEIIVILASSLLHIPVWSVCLRVVDVKKNGGRVRDILGRKVKVLEEPVEEFVGDYEDDDVKKEREKVKRMTSVERGGGDDEGTQPIVVVKVGVGVWENLKTLI
jgi:ATP-binding cassette subfamily A (ABC1) protein 5